MNKAELIDEVSKAAGVSKTQVEAVLNAAGAVATDALWGGDDVPLPGLGKLTVTQRAARIGRNPATGEALSIPARKAVTFGAAKALKDALNPVMVKKGKK